MHSDSADTDYIIRQAKENELADLKEMLIRNGQYPGIIMNERTLFFLAEKKAKNEGEGEEENKTKSEGSGIIGLTGAEISCDVALIRSTAVLAPYRGKGIAKKLVDTLLESLKKKGIRQLYLFSRDTGSFWSAFGFTGCPVQDVIRDAPDAHQVISYIKDGSIWNDVAWHRPM